MDQFNEHLRIWNYNEIPIHIRFLACGLITDFVVFLGCCVVLTTTIFLLILAGANIITRDVCGYISIPLLILFIIFTGSYHYIHLAYNKRFNVIAARISVDGSYDK
jgi:hypothetical protein